MPLPDEDVAIVRQWVDALNSEVPEHVRTQLRYEIDTHRNALTLVECRPAEVAIPTDDWFRVPLARLRFEPTEDVTILLAEIDDDPTCIFFG
jgi:hypothetical protein